MPAVSKQQQKFMGIVHAIQKGDMPAGKATGDAQEAARTMNPSDVTDFASTKRKGLPSRSKQSSLLSLLSRCANPFAQLRMAKSAALSNSLRTAEKALRKAEAARRQSLESSLDELRAQNEKLQQQADQAATTAAQSNANAAASAAALANPMPTPPAAQPQYGAMAAGGERGAQAGQTAGQSPQSGAAQPAGQMMA